MSISAIRGSGSNSSSQTEVGKSTPSSPSLKRSVSEAFEGASAPSNEQIRKKVRVYTVRTAESLMKDYEHLLESDEQKNTARSAIKYLTGMNKSENLQQVIVDIIKASDGKLDSSLLIKLVKEFCRNLSPDKYLEALNVILDVTKKYDSFEGVDDLDFCFSELKEAWQRRLLLEIRLRLPPLEDAVLKRIVFLVSLYSDSETVIFPSEQGGFFCDISKEILKMLDMVPPDCRLELIDEIIENASSLGKLRNHPLADILDENESLLNRVIPYIIQLLQRETNKEKAHALAAEVLIMCNVLLDEPGLSRVAVGVLAESDPADEDPWNSYNFYAKIEDSTIDLEPSKSPEFVHENEKYPLNLKGFKEFKNRTVYKAKDLPNLRPAAFSSLFTDLIDRKEWLDPDARDKVDDEIKKILNLRNIQECPVDYVKSLVYAESKLVWQLLNEKRKPEQIISPETFYLYRIVGYLDDTRKIRLKPDQLLSTGEIAFLKFLAKVTECNTGQGDGIAIFYNENLPSIYRLSAGLIPNVQKVKDLVGNTAQAYLGRRLANEKLLSALSFGADEQGNLTELSGMTNYLKNILHRSLGLVHQLTFDSGLKMLPKKLKALSYQELLDRVVGSINVKGILTAVKNDIGRNLQAKLLTYKSLVDFYEELCPLESVEVFFVQDDKGNVTGVTDKGAFQMLLALDYLQRKKE